MALAVPWVIGLYREEPTYEATVKMLVSHKSQDFSESCFREVCLLPTYPSEDAANPQDVTLTVANVADTMPVARAVVEQLKGLNLSNPGPEQSAEEVLRNMSAEPEPATLFVDISYEDSDPQRAQLIANTIGEVL